MSQLVKEPKQKSFFTTLAESPSTNEFMKGIWKDNPVFVQVLGMCPTLAVTNTAENALAMGFATTFVLVMSNILVSALRNVIPKEVRIASYILIIATFVTMTDYAIQAISVDLHKSLGAFISLIVVNCLILSRAEAFASKNTVIPSVLDGLGMGLGFVLVYEIKPVVWVLFLVVAKIWPRAKFGPRARPPKPRPIWGLGQAQMHLGQLS